VHTYSCVSEGREEGKEAKRKQRKKKASKKETAKIPVDTPARHTPPNLNGSNPAPPSYGEYPTAELLPSSNCIHCLGPSNITGYPNEWIKGHHETRTGLLPRW
jgi:hypothetical protein